MRSKLLLPGLGPLRKWLLKSFRLHSGPSRGTSFALIKGVTSHHAVSNIMRWMTRDPDARYKLAMNMYKDTDPPLTIEVGREVVTSKRL